MKMRKVLSVLVRERERLGDREPILVNSFFVPQRQSAPRPVAAPSLEASFCPRAATYPVTSWRAEIPLRKRAELWRADEPA